MSVIVKGVDMPKSCGSCFVGDRTICHDGCPLGEIPTPHGRLVEFIDVITKVNEDDGTEEVCVGDVFKAYYEMKNSPTVIEAEE